MTMSSSRLLGEIALNMGLINREQLLECLLLKEQDGTKPLGRILLQKKYITLGDLERLLSEQKKLINGKLFGEILIEEKLATSYQVNECLRVQGMFRDMNIKPVARLGEIMLKKKYITEAQLDIALSKLSKELYACDKCGNGLDGKSIKKKSGSYYCVKCKKELPGLLVDMVLRFEGDIKAKSDMVDLDVPEEVQQIAADESRHFGDYILIDELGEGGTGVVHKAWDKKFNRYVAIKMLSHDTKTGVGIETPFGDAEDLRRFYVEIKASTELLHPNIIPVYDFGVKDSFMYFVMEYIDGLNFEEFMKKKRWTWKRYLKQLIAVCEALDYAHSKKIYHRDLKPSNILVDRGNKPWIIDFGLASVKGFEVPTDVKDYVIIGTPYYMSPEQSDGNIKEMDERSDIYSIGAILYHIATGRAPFADEKPEDAVEKVKSEDPVMPTKINRKVSKEFEDVILKAMHKNRKKRYQKMRELIYDLRSIISGNRPVFCYHARGTVPYFLQSFLERDNNRRL